MTTLISVEMLAPNIVLKLAKYNLNKNTFSSTFSAVVGSGADERHFKYLSKEKINEMIKAGRNMPECVLRIMKFNDTDVGFLYAVLNGITTDKKGKNKFTCYEINLLYIIDDYRKNGIATRAILELEKEYKELEISEIYVRCEKTHSKGAIALFKKLGYTYFGEFNNKNRKLFYNVYKKRLTA